MSTPSLAGRRRPSPITLASILVASLLVAGCDSDDGGRSEDEVESSVEPFEPASPPEPEPDESHGSEPAGSGADAEATDVSNGSSGRAGDPDAGGATEKEVSPDSTDGVSRAELRKFANIQIGMERFTRSDAMAGEPESERQRVERMARVERRTNELMNEAGLERRRYLEIGRAIRSNPELRRRLQERIQQLQSANADAR